MNTVTVIFTRKRSLGSVLLRAWMHSRFSHCALVDTQAGTVIEASVHGVRERPLADLKAESSYFEELQLPCADPALALELARREIGKPYDWAGVAGFWTRRDWNRANAWLCSELVVGIVLRAGTPLFRKPPHRISPEMLYLPLFER